ncbi:serine hydrolase [Pseudorhodoferax sp.]|uniref:serine hydrolase n=1 Tax=Pseudorhodoferax sp. TaxID=1993553 RepID=UPI0039E533CC
MTSALVPTRRTSLKAAAALALQGAWPGPSLAQAAPTPRSEGPLGPLLARRLQHQGVALAAMRIRQGQAEHGSAAVRGPLPDALDLFALGSITKTFTALLLADAVVRGEIRLDDAVEDVLPDGLRLRDSRDQPLRWRDLATHRSGLPRLPGNLLTAGAADPYAGYGWREMALFLRGWRGSRPRDTQYAYSNLGYGLLGQALALRAGAGDYPALLARRVLQPLGLAADIGFAAPAGRRTVQGHDADGRPAGPWHFEPAMAGAGALLGCTRGLQRYAQAALGAFEHPLQPAFTLCLQRHGDGPGPINPVGLAWLLAPLDGRTLFNHEGATAGFAASLWLDPVRRTAAAVLSGAATEVGDLALHLAAPEVPPKDFAATRQAAMELPADAVAPLTGVYAFTPQFKLQLRAEGARLFAQATGQGEFELFAQGPRRFFARVTPLEVAFEGEQGVPPALLLFQGGQQMRAVRE